MKQDISKTRTQTFSCVRGLVRPFSEPQLARQKQITHAKANSLTAKANWLTAKANSLQGLQKQIAQCHGKSKFTKSKSRTAKPNSLAAKANSPSREVYMIKIMSELRIKNRSERDLRSCEIRGRSLSLLVWTKIVIKQNSGKFDLSLLVGQLNTIFLCSFM